MAARRESGEKRQSAIREECRVTFYFGRLGPWQPWFFVMPYFPHWSEEKSAERKKEKQKERNKGWHRLQEGERTRAAEFLLFTSGSVKLTSKANVLVKKFPYSDHF